MRCPLETAGAWFSPEKDFDKTEHSHDAMDKAARKARQVFRRLVVFGSYTRAVLIQGHK